MELGDRAYKVIVSTKGSQDDISDELASFLEYVSNMTAKTDLTRLIDDLVKKAHAHIEWRKEYMTLLERDERMREEGRKEGRKEGLEEGRKEERANTEREAARADAAEKENLRLRAEIEALRQKSSQPT